MARKFLPEFREFAIKGNVLDLAIGVVIGTAFGKIVSSLVADLITPLIALVTGAVDFKSLAVVVREGRAGVPPVALHYGAFLQTVFDFLIISLSIFVAIRFINTVRRRFEAEKKVAEMQVAQKSQEEKLLEEIRDILKKK